MNTACASTPDEATIVNSGSTNTAGYTIDVKSEGSAVLTLHGRPGMDVSTAPKAFKIQGALAARFFADLKAVREANVIGAPCMKSASFGSTTRVSWHDWKSPDLECPSQNGALGALIADVGAIRDASGLDSLPGIHHGAGSGGPVRIEPSPSKPPGEKS